MGRPPKDPADLAKIELTVRFTEEEKSGLESLQVELRERSLAEVVRRAVRELHARTFKRGKRGE